MKHLIKARALLKEAQKEFDRRGVHIEYGTKLSYFNSTIEELRKELQKRIIEEFVER